MSIEDLTYRCNGCDARVVVRPETQEAASQDGTLGTRAFMLQLTTPGELVPAQLQGHDRVRVKIPEGWDRRHGPKGTAFLHRCPSCVAADVRFA